MQTTRKSFLTSCLVLCTVLAGLLPGISQTQVVVGPSKSWAGFMNVFSLPADGGGYLFGGGWGASDLRAAFSGDLLTLQSCTNVSNPTNAYWVKPDGSGNKQMQANWYVDTASLVGSNVTFSGNVVDYALTTNYTCQAFIKVFNSSYSSVLQSVSTPLTNAH